MNIYIGNFSYETTEDELRSVFEPFGVIDKLMIVKDKFSGDSKGFGFVEMPNKGEAEAAIEGIKEIGGRTVTINEARPRTQSGSFGGGRDRRPNNKPRRSY